LFGVSDGILPADIKRVSALRRVSLPELIRFRSEHSNEGDVCAFELPLNASPIALEAPSGRTMAIAPGETFLATPGYRESTRWVDGSIPSGGLVPGNDYCILADCGVVGELVGFSPAESQRLAFVRYLGVVYDDRDETLNIRQFAVTRAAEPARDVLIYLMLGSSGDVGKTTAGITILRTLRMKGHAAVTVLKATGTSSVEELTAYQDFGATQSFDCVDFGLPTTYPSGREGIGDFFADALDYCLSLSAQALVVECGGDLFGANVPEFLSCLRARFPNPRVTFAAADALGALGAKQVLADIGLSISLITGPCTDTPTMRARTAALCGVPAINLMSNSSQEN
jgi:hypothetical protein